MIGQYLLSLKNEKIRQGVLHLHGIYDIEESIIFSKDEYDKAYKRKKIDINNESKIGEIESIQKNILWTLLSTRQLVFVGFGMSDPYLEKMLQNTCSDLCDYHERKHFAIMPFKKDEYKKEIVTRFKKNMGYKFFLWN